MLSYHFLFNDKLPCDHNDLLINGKKYLLQGEFKQANDCFNQVSQNHSLKSEVRDWGTLLGCYTRLIESQFSAGCSKSSYIVLLPKQKNPTLVDTELKEYENVKGAMRQLIIANKKMNFSELHERAWRNNYVEYIMHKDVIEARKVLTAMQNDLVNFNNHYYYFLEFYTIRFEQPLSHLNLDNLEKAENLLTKAIECCPNTVYSFANLAYYYGWRAKIRTSQYGLTKNPVKRFEIMSDFQSAFFNDNLEHSDFSVNIHTGRLQTFLDIFNHLFPDSSDQDLDQMFSISKKCGKYAEDKSYQLYQNKLRLLGNLLYPYLKEASLREEKKVAAKKKKKRKPKPLTQSVNAEMVEEPKQQEAVPVQRNSLPKKEIRKLVVNLIHQAVDKSELQKKAHEEIESKIERQRKFREKKALKKLERLERKRNQAEEKYWDEETIPFEAIGDVHIPLIIITVGQCIKSLPGRTAKRVYVYGGTARKVMGSYDKPDYDLRVPELSVEVAQVLKSILGLKELPKEKNGIFTVRILIQTSNGTTKKATLTITPSIHLANESLSFMEALRLDMLSLDYLQNGFIAMLSEKGPLCKAYYPLNLCHFYFAATLDDAREQLLQTRIKENLSDALIKIACPAFFLVGNGQTLKVYFFINGEIEKTASGNPLSFDLTLKDSDRELLVTNTEGRVIFTRDNQHRIIQLIDEINHFYQSCRHQSLHNLTRGIAERVARLSKMETILEPGFSLATDPVRFLRLIYLTTSLNYTGFSETMKSAVFAKHELYSKFLVDHPGKINSWMNKLFCRDGKNHLIENFDYLIDLGLLQLSFPGLFESSNHNTIKRWLTHELNKTQKLGKPSLDYLYCVFIQCVVLHTQKTPEQVIAENPLFIERFKNITFNKLAEKNWEQFKIMQPSSNRQQSKPYVSGSKYTVFSRTTHHRQMVNTRHQPQECSNTPPSILSPKPFDL